MQFFVLNCIFAYFNALCACFQLLSKYKAMFHRRYNCIFDIVTSVTHTIQTRDIVFC
jgi:hypothetical protein